MVSMSAYSSAHDRPVKAALGGVAVGKRCAVGDCQAIDSVHLAEFGSGHGMIFEGVAGGRRGGTDEHLMQDCIWMGEGV